MDLVKMSKLKAMKDCKGESLLQYICKQLVAQDEDFAAQMFSLNILFREKKKMTDMQTPYSKLDSMFEEAKQAYLDVNALDEQEPEDSFKSLVGDYIVNWASTEMDYVEKTTKEVKENHTQICDFYGFDKSDELRTNAVDFFDMWSSFFTDVVNSLPKGKKEN